jgi:hypothetical protein
MIKSFIVERDVLTQVWVKQKFTVEAEDKTSAINLIRRTPKEDVYSMFEHTSEVLMDTEQEISSHINVDNCYEIPHQPKLNL